MLLRNSLTKSLPLKRLIAAASPATAASNKMRLLSTTGNTSGFPTPILFDYETIKNNLTVADAISSVEEAFGALANGKVDVPMPMHIGIEESEVAGPGDCHIKVRRIRQIRHPVHGKVLKHCTINHRREFALYLRVHFYTHALELYSFGSLTHSNTPKSFTLLLL